ncbi:RNA 2',3'-cyclic phosphodiesterase [Halorubrum sp. SP3]|nr:MULTISPECIES: RNA 2',3'-cyclic phosphodiesterase [unclassified Halorubrum]TKX54070.1 RNA 2',3'-cyclic phosphodiesterase [Halorubrum sp. SP3]TKX69000.1 RNA 2',3'-cyclic phosphodiesterase [Halorubrum sp. SP9]
MRAFFAVDLPESLAAGVAAAQAPFADAHGVNPVDPEQAHVTLKFLGDVARGDEDDSPNDSALDDVIAAGERAVDRAGVAPFDCAVGGLGVFPNRDYVSVVWAGIERGGDDLTALHRALEAETTALGVDPADHAFTPHVTLARVENAAGAEAVRDALDDGEVEVGSCSVDEVRLMKSTLTASGPEYETVREFELE